MKSLIQKILFFFMWLSKEKGRPRISKLLTESWKGFVINDMLMEANNSLENFEALCVYAHKYPIKLNIYGGSLTRAIINHGSYQLEHFNHISKIIDTHEFLFINVGANIGTSILNAHLSGFRKFIAFEPIEQNFSYLKYNIQSIKKDSTIDLKKVGVGNQSGSFPLHLNEFVWGMHSFKKNFNYKDQLIDVIRLDDLRIHDNNFLYIDAEGFELEILQGAKNLLINTIGVCAEVTPQYMTTSEINKLRNLINKNFRRHFIKGKLIERDITEKEMYNNSHQFDLISFK